MTSVSDTELVQPVSTAALSWDDCVSLIDNLVDYAIFTLDAAGNVTTWNRGAEKIYGYRSDEIIGRHFSAFYLADDIAEGKPGQSLATASTSGRSEDQGWRRRKDGTRFWASAVSTAMRDANGALRGFGRVVHDLSAKRASEEKVRRAEEPFHHLVDAITDYAVFLLDSSGHVATWNPGAQRTKGYDSDEIIGQHFSRFYTPEDRAAGKPERVLETVRREGRFEEESWRVRKDGSRFWAHVVITALRDDQGQVIGFAKVTRDLTVKRAAEEIERRLADERLARAASDYERHKLLALLAEVPAIVNFLRGPDLTFEFVHPKATEILGGRAVLGKPMLEAVPEMAEQPYYRQLRRVYETGEPFSQHEVLAWHRNGDRKVESYWSSSYLPVRDAAGAIEGVMTFDLNVTESVLARRQLERANRSLQSLMDLAIALATTRTPDDVGAVVVDQGMRTAEADTCTVYLLDEETGMLELIAHRGIDELLVQRIRRISRADAPGIFGAFSEGTALWAETREDYLRIHPSLANAQVDSRRARAFWSVPLLVEGRSVGLLGMGFYEEQRFSPERRSLVEALATQCAQALLRAARLDQEARARAWFATTLRSIGDAVITTDTQGHVTFMNVVAEQLTGWSELEARGRPLEEVFVIHSEETRKRSESPVIKVLREGQVVGLANHTALRPKHGPEIPIDDSAAPIKNPQGVLLGVVLVFRDATERKRNEIRRDFLARAGAVLASSLNYRETLAAVAQIVVPQLADWCTVDLLEDGVIRQLAVAHVDPEKVAWAREVGERYPADRDALTGIPNVLRTGKSELYPEITSAMLEAGARDEEHLRVLRDLQLESVMLVPVKGRERTLGAISLLSAGSGRRYTEDDLKFVEEFARRAAMAIENALAFKQAEEARAKEGSLRRQAEEANRTKDEFLALVSHELRTPLSAIVGWTKILSRKQLDPGIAKAVEVIDRNAQAQVKIIDDILDVARIVTGKLKLELRPMDLVSVASQAMEVIRPSADAKNISLEFQSNDQVSLLVGDPERLQQVVWNLLSNAVKFTEKGGNIRVAIEHNGSTFALRISDTGKGIEQEFLPHLFEAFRQADASAARRVGGLGLGLALVRHIVELHGGTVHAESPGLGHGSTFTITLPIRAIIPPSALTDRTPSAPPAGPAAEAIRGLRILVVDDDEDGRAIVTDVLRDAGAIVQSASSASEGFHTLQRFRPQLLISDIGMPGEDGFSFIRRVRALPRGAGGVIPAIALTAYTRREDRTKALASGFTTHIGKPVNPDDLVAAVVSLALYVQS